MLPLSDLTPEQRKAYDEARERHTRYRAMLDKHNEFVKSGVQDILFIIAPKEVQEMMLQILESKELDTPSSS